MEEKKYLKWYNKVSYGSGDLAANCVYSVLASFILIYLTDTAGLNTGIVGTLIMLSKFLDGISDVIFGTLIDRTHSKMGKARPWMLWLLHDIRLFPFTRLKLSSPSPSNG